MFPILPPVPIGYPSLPVDWVPVGSVLNFLGEVVDDVQEVGQTCIESWGWMVCDGRSLEIGVYPRLYAVLGNRYGSADESHFNLPDMRGYFMRGVDPKQTVDKDGADRTPAANGKPNEVGSTQSFALQSHEHQYHAVTMAAVANAGNAAGPPPGALQNTVNGPQDAIGADEVQVSLHETRSVNIYVHFIIKYASLPCQPTRVGPRLTHPEFPSSMT